MIGDLGGSLGLWIGWSVITVFEFIELIVDCFVLMYIKRKKGPELPRDKTEGEQTKGKKSDLEEKKDHSSVPYYYRRENPAFSAGLGSVDNGKITPTDINTDFSRLAQTNSWLSQVI